MITIRAETHEHTLPLIRRAGRSMLSYLPIAVLFGLWRDAHAARVSVAVDGYPLGELGTDAARAAARINGDRDHVCSAEVIDPRRIRLTLKRHGRAGLAPEGSGS